MFLFGCFSGRDLVAIAVRLSPRILTVSLLRFCTVVKWCLDNSISSQVTTPATAQDLSSALISALESNTVSPVAAPNDVTFDILLAEDNLVNQKLAVKILEKYGHAVEIAENGSLAVDSYKLRVAQGRPFDIVLVSAAFSFLFFPLPSLSLSRFFFALSCFKFGCFGETNADNNVQMDVSMPFMGGMEATELIRAFELHEGLDRTPIIALTAHASAFFLPFPPLFHILTKTTI